MNFDARGIAAATAGEVLRDGLPGPIATDSRNVRAGDWFLALHGERFDGHAFLGDVADRGAAGVIVARDLPFPRGLVRVIDTTRALQDLGRASRARLHCGVVGVGGASGKTTTRALTGLALQSLGTVHQTVGNLNNHLGVPMSLVAAPESADVVVLELGTSGPGEIALLCDIARPTVRIVVNVGPEHLEGLGDLDGVAKEEGALFESAVSGDVLVVNLDDPYVRAMPRPKGVRVVTYGEASDADVRLVDAVVDAATLSTSARFRTPMGDVSTVLPVPGRHVAHDAAGALAVAWSLAADLEAAARAFRTYAPVGMRLRKETLANGVQVLNDAYNANPTSVEAALAVLATLPGRRIACLGDMLELGPGEARLHEEVAAKAGAGGFDLVVLCGPRMAAAARACVGAREVWAEPDVPAVAAKLRRWLRPGDHLLLKGSRGMRLERILQGLQG